MTFKIPDGVKFKVQDGRVLIQAAGNIEIATQLGPDTVVRSTGGSVFVTSPAAIDEVEAPAGDVIVAANLIATRVHGRRVLIKATRVDARIIQASAVIAVGATQVNGDILIAPQVGIDPSATGKVTVIESHNSPGAHGIKGGLSLADLEDMFGGSAEFMRDRGLAPLPAPGGSDRAVEAGGVDEIEAVEVEALEAESEDEPIEQAPPPRRPTGPAELTAASIESIDTVDDPAYRLAREALDRIHACYEGASPEPIRRLDALVEARDFATIKGQINELWKQVILHHQRAGMRMPAQLPPNFNAINSLIRSL